MTHRVDIRPDLRATRGYGREPMVYRGELLGTSNNGIYDAARLLLARGLASPEDTVEMWRGETLCMSGIAGRLAKWTVRENDPGNPTFQLVRWKPFAGAAVGQGTPKNEFQARCSVSLIPAVPEGMAP